MSKIIKNEKMDEVNSNHISQMKAGIDSLIATHAADDDVHHVLFPYWTLPISLGGGGFTNMGTRWDILNSDAASHIYAHTVCPETRTDWKVCIVSRSSVVPMTDNGDMDVGAAGSNEATSGNNKINAALNLAHTVGEQAKYSYTAVFSMDAGDHVNVRWSKNNNAGAGTLRIEEMFLTH